MKTLIGVIGAGQCDADIAAVACEVGREIARRGYGLVCGGLGGVMEAAAQGCRENDGLTVGIIPGEAAHTANKYIDIVIPSGMGIARNLLVVRSSAGIIAVDGKYGTLSEIAFALQLGVPIAGIKTWDVSDNIMIADDAKSALDKLEVYLKK